MWPTALESLMVGGPVSAGMWTLLWAVDRFGRPRPQPYRMSIARPAYVKDFAIQCLLGHNGFPPVFAPDEHLVANVHNTREFAPMFSTAVAWHTSGGRQTGWKEGQILVRFTQDQMDAVRAASPCYVWVIRTVRGDLSRTEAIARFDLPHRA